MYNLPLPVLLCYAQALRSETSYCYYRVHCSSACPSVATAAPVCPSARLPVCPSAPRTVLCGALYTACVDASRTVFWDRSSGRQFSKIGDKRKTRIKAKICQQCTIVPQNLGQDEN